MKSTGVYPSSVCVCFRSRLWSDLHIVKQVGTDLFSLRVCLHVLPKRGCAGTACLPQPQKHSDVLFYTLLVAAQSAGSTWFNLVQPGCLWTHWPGLCRLQTLDTQDQIHLIGIGTRLQSRSEVKSMGLINIYPLLQWVCSNICLLVFRFYDDL